MAFLYVKSGGTATGSGGSYSSAQTGTWFSSTSGYYGTLNSLFDNVTLADGDTVCISNVSTVTVRNKTIPLAANTWEQMGDSPYIGIYCRLISVDDTDMGVPSAGAIVEIGCDTNNNYEYYLSFSFSYIWGIQINELGKINGQGVYDSLYFGSYQDNSYKNFRYQPGIFENCTFSKLDLVTYYRQFVIGGDEKIFKNCSFLQKPGFYRGFSYDLWGGADRTTIGSTTYIGCTFTMSSLTYEGVFNTLGYWNGFYNGATLVGQALFFIACYFDLPSTCYLARDTSAGPQTSITRDRCSFPSAYSKDREFIEPVTSLDPESGELLTDSNVWYDNTNLWVQRVATALFLLESTKSIYRENGATLYSGERFSYSLKHGIYNQYSVIKPFNILLGELWIGNYAVPKTIIVYFARNNSAASIKDDQIWLDFTVSSYVSGELEASKGNTYCSFPMAFNLDYTPTNLPSDTATWTGLTNPTKQYVSKVVPAQTAPYLLTISLWSRIGESTYLYIEPQIRIV